MSATERPPLQDLILNTKLLEKRGHPLQHSTPHLQKGTGIRKFGLQEKENAREDDEAERTRQVEELVLDDMKDKCRSPSPITCPEGDSENLLLECKHTGSVTSDETSGFNPLSTSVLESLNQTHGACAAAESVDISLNIIPDIWCKTEYDRDSETAVSIRDELNEVSGELQKTSAALQQNGDVSHSYFESVETDIDQKDKTGDNNILENSEPVNDTNILGCSEIGDITGDSSKTEDELLASDASTCLEDEKSVVSESKPATLPDVSFTDRVKSATSSLASCVFPSEIPIKQIEWIQSSNTVKLLQDVSCSPMPDNLVKRKESSASSGTYSPGAGISNSPMPHVKKLNFSSRMKDVACSPLTSVSQSAKKDGSVDKSCTSDNCSSPKLSLKEIKTGRKLFQNVTLVDVATSPQRFISSQETQTSTDKPLSSLLRNQHSVMCSPMPFSVQDTSTETDRENACDVSVLTDSAASIVPQSSDIAIQNTIDLRSAQCSPMTPGFIQDGSVIALRQGVTDSPVSGQPSVSTMATMTDRATMISCSTTMTPMKIDKKKGKSRLTAEDIRRQHPRTVANQLDTLRIENERMECVIQSLHLEKDKLKNALKEAKNAQNKAEKQLQEMEEQKQDDRQEIQKLNKKCADVQQSLEESQARFEQELSALTQNYQELERRNAELKVQHEASMCELKEEYERSSYQGQFLTSQKLVNELQAELAGYAVLAEDMERSRFQQCELETALNVSVNKLKSTADQLLARQSKLTQREQSLVKQRDEMSVEEMKLESEKQKLEEERQEIDAQINKLEQNLAQQETQYQKTVSDLELASSAVSSLQAELNQSQVDSSEKQTLIEELRKRESELCQVVEQTKNSLAISHENFQEATEKSSQVIINLQRTLEMREHDIDTMENDLFEIRENYYLNSEKITNLEYKEKSLCADLKEKKEENLRLKDCLATLRAKEQELRVTLSNTQEELTCTKNYASQMLSQQAVEIADCSTAMNDLFQEMCGALKNLNARAGLAKNKFHSSKPVVSETETSPASSEHNLDSSGEKALDLSLQTQTPQVSQNSFVSQILIASSQTDGHVDVPQTTESSTDTVCETDKVLEDAGRHLGESPGAISRKKLGSSSSRSAFAAVKSTGGQPNVDSTASLIKPSQKPLNSSGGSVACDVEEGTTVTADTMQIPTVQDSTLSHQVEMINRQFEEILRVALIIEKAAKSSLMDVRIENEDLSDRLSQCQFEVKCLQGEINLKTQELQESRSIVKDLHGKLEDIDAESVRSMEQELEIQKFQHEMRKLHSKIKTLETENELLTEQHAEVLQRLQSLDQSGVSVRNEKEILALKKRVEKLRNQLLEKQDYVEEISNRASRRIRKLEANWKKAESEVVRFDDLMEIIRKILMKNSHSFKENQDLRNILKLIDGREPLPVVAEKGDDGKLRPMKTS